MNTQRLALGIVGVLATAALGAGAAHALAPQDRGPAASDAVVDPATAARTSFPGLRPATGEPTLPGLRSAAPATGTVGRIPGPFDDRFHFDHVALDRRGVTGSVTITSDVSDLLELQVLVGFYDRDGALLGTGRFVHHAVEDGHVHDGPPSEVEQFAVVAPQRIRDRVAAAAVGVPVLVNE